MSLEATPAQAARHLAMLDELCEIGMDFSRILHEQVLKPDTDHEALTRAFEGVALGIRRAILLSCSLERLLRKGPAPAPGEPTHPGKPDPGATPSAAPNERGDRLDRIDRLNGLFDLSVEDRIATLEHRILTAAATVLDIPKPPKLPKPPLRPAEPPGRW